jgi:hypothetical protein
MTQAERERVLHEFRQRAVSFDLETDIIQPGLLAPPIVCGSVAYQGESELLTVEQARVVFRNLLESNMIIVGANITFDILCMAYDAWQRGIDLMPLIFAKYDRGEVFDILTCEALNAVAHGYLGKYPNGQAMKKADTGKVTKYYGQEHVVRIVLGRDDAKRNDEWRKKYHELRGIPFSEWPATARQYPIDDADLALQCAVGQVWRACHQVSNIHDLPRQVRAAWAMHVGAAWGFKVDVEELETLFQRVKKAWDEGLGRWQAMGIFRADGSQNGATTAELVARAYGATAPCPACHGVCWQCNGTTRIPGARANTTKTCPNCKPTKKEDKPRPRCDTCKKTGLDIDSAAVPVPRAEKGGISSGRDALHESGDNALIDLAEWLEEKKILQTYVPYLRKGGQIPLTLKPNVLKETGRTSYGDVIHQLPRSGGVRECIMARDGYVLSSTDYGQVELYTHSESCYRLLGYSKLGEALNAGIEVHVRLAAAMAGISYEEGIALHLAGDPWFKAFRQAAKPGNYGFPGGMGAFKLVLQQRKQGPDTTAADGTKYKGLRFCILVRGAARCGEEMITEYKGRTYTPACKSCVEVAQVLREKWMEEFPENKDYFRLISEQVEQFGWVQQHVTGRIRGNVQFTSAANGYFQGLAADGAKDALYRVVKECFDPSSVLYGSRVIAFQHDEIVAEHPIAVASVAAKRISEIMVETMRGYVPRVAKNLVAEPALMPRWYKGAEPIHDAGGTLIPWTPARAKAMKKAQTKVWSPELERIAA